MDISALIAGLAYSHTLVGALMNERDSQKAAAIKIELTEKITAAQIQLSQVLAAVIDKDATIHRLSERNRDLEAAQREKERYRLARIGAVGEAFAYQLRPAAELSERSDEPTHFICQPCFDSGRKAVLQMQGPYAACPVCESKIALSKGAEPPISYPSAGIF
jgi:DNA-directed RNA polymerase subunit RPC12/RpoP